MAPHNLPQHRRFDVYQTYDGFQMPALSIVACVMIGGTTAVMILRGISIYQRGKAFRIYDFLAFVSYVSELSDGKSDLKSNTGTRSSSCFIIARPSTIMRSTGDIKPCPIRATPS
jgi:hypothetical protein